MSADVPRSDGPIVDEPTEDQPIENPEFGDLLTGLEDLGNRPVAEHHDRLAAVHEALDAALHEPPTAPASGSGN